MKPRKDTLTQSELKKIMYYDPDTGLLKWLAPKNGRKLKPLHISDGSISSDGYIQIQINKKRYYAHRLIWLYMTGEFPKNSIDHIDGQKTNNRFLNLRDTTQQQNMFNIVAKGYSYREALKKYQSRIRINGELIYLGHFKTEKKAKEAYIKAKIKYHGEEFSRRAIDTSETFEEVVYD